MRPDGTLRFGDFCACILNLLAAFSKSTREHSSNGTIFKLYIIYSSYQTLTISSNLFSEAFSRRDKVGNGTIRLDASQVCAHVFNALVPSSVFFQWVTAVIGC